MLLYIYYYNNIYIILYILLHLLPFNSTLCKVARLQGCKVSFFLLSKKMIIRQTGILSPLRGGGSLFGIAKSVLQKHGTGFLFLIL